MNLLETNPELCALMEQIINNQYVDTKKAQALCLVLKEKAAAANSEYGVCFAEKYLADCALAEGFYPAALEHLNVALALCRSHGFDSLLLDVYNLYGIISTGTGDHMQACEYYMRGLSLAEAMPNFTAQAMFFSNLGDMFLQLEQYNTALAYFKKSRAAVLQMPEGARKEHFKQVNKLNTAEAQLNLDMLQEAILEMEHFDAVQDGKEIATLASAAKSNYALALCRLGRTAEALPVLDSLIQAPQDGYDAHEIFFFSLYKAFEIALEMKDAARCTAILNALEKSPYFAHSLRRQRELADYKIAFLELFGTQDELYEAYKSSHALRLAAKADSQRDRAQSLETKIEAYHMNEKARAMEQYNATLQELSTLDDLTQLPNRRKLKAMLHSLHSNALHTQARLGIIIMDVDLFKTFNDTYGHISGDVLLRTAADSLRDDAQAFYPARYGGDEFVVLCEDCSEQEIVAYLQRCFARFATAQKALPQTAATFSAGYCNNSFLRKVISTEDLLFYADKALYAAKAQGRDRFVSYDTL